MTDARLARESVEVIIVTPGAARLVRESVEVIWSAVPPPEEGGTGGPFIGWGIPL